MRVAVQGCCNGDLDRLYDAVRKLGKQGIAIDLLICCGDFQSVRDEKDLDCMWAPPQYKEMKDFHKYYSGEKQAPVLTIFIGGKNEASNLLREHYFGGWVAPKIYYLGCAGVVRVGPLRIAGISGHFASSDYFRGHHECPPYTDETKKSAFHVREWDVARLERLQEPVDIVVSYDWPRGIWKFGNYEQMFEQQDLSGDLKREMEGNTLGSPAAMDLLKKLRPPFWFAANLQVKFPALVPHGDGTFTRFLALDRCRGGKEFLQVLDIDPASPSGLKQLPPPVWQGRSRQPCRTAPPLCFDPEWLALQKANHQNMSFSWQMEKAKLAPPSKDEVSWVAKRLKDKVGSVPRPKAASKRHPNLVPTKLRESTGDGKHSFRNFSTLQLRELYETRGLEFPGHLDKASMIKQLEEFDEFFAEEGGGEGDVANEAYPIPVNFDAAHSNPTAQRTLILELLELNDVWKDQEDERRELTKVDQPEEAYDPFSEAPETDPTVEADSGEITASAADDDGDAEVVNVDPAEANDNVEAVNVAEAIETVDQPGDCGLGGDSMTAAEDGTAMQAADGMEVLPQALEASNGEDAVAEALESTELDASAAALAAAVMGLEEVEEADTTDVAAGQDTFDAESDTQAALAAIRQESEHLEALLAGAEDVAEQDHDEAAAGMEALARALAEAEGEEEEEAEEETIIDADAHPPKRIRRRY